jgi:hypothetical protein
MAHTKADIVETTRTLIAALDKERGILMGVIAAIDNTKRAILMVTAPEEPMELREEDVPAVKGFFKGLAEKLPAAGNGQ